MPLEHLIAAAMRIPGARNLARASANWTDLQWTLLNEQLGEIASRAHGKLLDVGCGDRPYEDLFQPYVESYTGIEHESSFQRTNASSSAKRPDFFYDGIRLPFDDASFDSVLNVQVLEHTPQPQHLLNEMARVLAPGGTLILNAPFSFRLHEQPHDYFRYSPHGLRVMCAEAGMEVTDVMAQGGLWSVLGHKLNSFLAFRVGRFDGILQQLGKLGHEEEATRRPRTWLLPAVVPLMIGVSAGARIFDDLIPDDTEALSYLVIAQRVKDKARATPKRR